MKVNYLIEEKLTYIREIILETSLTEGELIIEMENGEENAQSAEDVAMWLHNHPQIKILKMPSHDFSSPTDAEVEYYDHRMEENK